MDLPISPILALENHASIRNVVKGIRPIQTKFPVLYDIYSEIVNLHYRYLRRSKILHGRLSLQSAMKELDGEIHHIESRYWSRLAFLVENPG